MTRRGVELLAVETILGWAHHPREQPDAAEVRKGDPGDGGEKEMGEYTAVNVR